jgi:transposase
MKKEIEIDKLQETVNTQNQTIKELELKVKHLEEQLKLSLYLRFCAKSEKNTKGDKLPSVFDEATSPDNLDEVEKADEELSTSKSKPNKNSKAGRKPLPASIPRKQKIYDLTEEEKMCSCGSRLTPIGEVKSEQLEIIPAQIFVMEHIRKKYACKCCESTVKEAKLPPQPIPKSIASPGLLSHVIVSKYDYHLPLYRQEKILQHVGIDIPRATLSHWVLKSAKLLTPLIKLMQDIVQNYDVGYSDETTVQVLKEKARSPQSKSYMWCFGGGPPEQFCYLFHYHVSRGHEVPLDYLEDFKGYLHCDGFRAYDTLSSKTGVTLVGCWYHMRRKYVEAAKVGQHPVLANWVIDKIKLLSIIEKYCLDRKLSPDEIKEYRLKNSLPIIEEIKLWLDEKVLTVLPKSLLGGAIQYSLNQWSKLINFLMDGRLEISNNSMERIIKGFATGRKNWRVPLARNQLLRKEVIEAKAA